MTHMAMPMATGRMPRTMALILPSAVSAATSRRSRSRWTIVSATVSSSSDRLPPTSRWMRMAMTAQAKSGLVMRVAQSSSASSRGRPRRASTTTRRSSRPIGSWTSWETASTPCMSE